MKNTKTLTAAALLAALCVAILYLGSLVETLDLSVAILASLVVMICEVEYSYRVALPVFLVAGLLSLVLPLPTRSGALCFLCFFGWYPIFKNRLDGLKPFWSRVVKTLIFNASLALFYVLGAWLLTSGFDSIFSSKWLILATLLLGNACFLLYDLLLQRITVFYFLKIRPRLKF